MLLSLFIVPGLGAPGTDVTTEFREVETLFANPGKGWMAFRCLPDGPTRLPCSVAYFRLNWNEVEPEEGKYDWRPIDEAIQAWQARGARVAFRIMTTNAHSSGYYCSPKWLFDLGCRSHDYEAGGEDTMAGGRRIVRIEPDYSDPLYLEKHGAFLRALGERYDGSPGVEFLDIGSYGIWGEWHTANAASAEVRRRIIDLYLAALKRTPLVMMSDDAEMLNYALTHGTGFRRDGVGSPWHEQNWIGSQKYAGVEGFADAWKRAPAVFEWYGPYDFLMRRGWSFDSAIRFMLESHVTLINDNVGKVPPEAMPQLERLARLSGYRFVPRRLTHPASAAPGETLRMEMRWSNVGVGRLYRRYPLELRLLDAAGKVALRAEAAADARTWLPGDHDVTETLALPAGLAPGEYTLGLALVDADTGKPAIKLAIDAPETDGVYRVGRVTVR